MYVSGFAIPSDEMIASRSFFELKTVVDEVVCAETPEPFYAVGLWYENFEQTSDAEVCDLLAQAAHRPAALAHTG